MVDRYPTPRTAPSATNGQSSWESGRELMRRAIEAADNKRAMQNAREEFPRMRDPVGTRGAPTPRIPQRRPFKLPRTGGPLGGVLGLIEFLDSLIETPELIMAPGGIGWTICGSGSEWQYWGGGTCAANGVTTVYYPVSSIVAPGYTAGNDLWGLDNPGDWVPGSIRYGLQTGYAHRTSPGVAWDPRPKVSPLIDPTMVDEPMVDDKGLPEAAPKDYSPPDPNPEPQQEAAPEPVPETGFAPLTQTWTSSSGQMAPPNKGITYKPPGKGAKEIKLKVAWWYKAALTTFNGASEARDFVRAMWKALPRDERTLTPQQQIPVSKRNPAYKVGQQTLTQMAQDLYNAKTPWGGDDKANEFWDKALTNAIENQITDYLFGKFGQKGNEASRAARTHGDIPVGLQRGAKFR